MQSNFLGYILFSASFKVISELSKSFQSNNSNQLSAYSHVTLKVYDVLGNAVASLVNENKPAGRYTVEFYAGNLSSGIYFYRMTAGSYFETKKLILMK